MSRLPPHDCSLCPRLVTFRDQVADEYPSYHNAPVRRWGAADAPILIVGLAPGLHGAARTGRPFTGDASGDLLFKSLLEVGLATSETADGARLCDVAITNVVKCLPPQNQVKASEVNACGVFLEQELARYQSQRAKRRRAVVALGGVAFNALLRQFSCTISAHRFSQGTRVQLSETCALFASFHPSRLNANTGRIDQPRLSAVLRDAKTWCELS